MAPRKGAKKLKERVNPQNTPTTQKKLFTGENAGSGDGLTAENLLQCKEWDYRTEDRGQRTEGFEWSELTKF